MKKRIISALIAAAVTGSLIPSAVVSAEEEQPRANSSVSGYVSLDSGILLAGEEKRPTIYISAYDYDGVARAVNDLADDIKAVTGVTPVVTGNISSLPGDSGIVIGENSMSVKLDYPVSPQMQCFVASYDKDGNMLEVAKSSEMLYSNVGVYLGFGFDKVITKPASGNIKAFIWDENMKPLGAPVGMMPEYDADVIIGTLGKNREIDSLAKSGAIDVSEIEGKWESFTIQNVGDTVVIAGSDKRGTIYGIYDLSEKMGVSPWEFWADVQPQHEDKIYIDLPDGGYTEGEPSVQYRGIFMNDEYNLTTWSNSLDKSGNMNNATYEKIFELLLRLKANYCWPAMHTYSTAFNNTEHNAEIADKYGIVMGSSHAEPLLRNNLGELYNYQQQWQSEHPDKKLYINDKDDAKRDVSWMWTDKDAGGNAVDNKEFLTDYWKTRVQANGSYENTYTIGMRGVHDGRFNTNMNAQTAMTEILAAQRQILTDELCTDGRDISDVPQVFIPYKEMLDLYNGGLKVPDDVTLMWPDDNFGYIRQLSTEKERERSGGAGIYYHLSYYGRPTAYLWLGTTQPGLIREEMTKAYDMGAQKIWIANVGDLKPAETEIEYFLDLARDVEGMRNTDINDWLKSNAKRDFSFDDTLAQEYADIKLGYYEKANSRRPEHMANGLFSLTNFGDEGQRLIDAYADLEKRAQTLYSGLSDDKKPSFYELMLYPLRGAKSMAEKYIYSDKAKYYSENNYGAAANKYAKLSDEAYQRVLDDTAEYNSMLGGKWDKMMNPYQTQLRGSFGGPISGKLDSATVSEAPYTNMEIITEDSSVEFTKYSTEPEYIDIINTGTGSFDWEAVWTAEWIQLNKTSGTVADNDRIYISVDASKADEGLNSSNIVFNRKIGENVVQEIKLNVTLKNTSVIGADNEGVEKLYVENDGYLSIEAEHYSDSVKNGEYEWKVEKDFGRSGDSVKIYPNTAAAVSNPNKNNSAYLEYSAYFTSAGTFPIELYRMPTINELSGSTMRCRIGIDDNTPVQFNGNTKTTDNSTGADAWGKGVLQNTEIVTGNITVPSAGLHTIRLYNESPGVVIDKFVIITDTANRKSSYFGAPESYNTTYNNTMKSLPASSKAAEEQTGSISALFEPSMLFVGTTDSKANILKLGEINEGILVAASYNSKGMIDATYTRVDLSDIDKNEIKEIEYDGPSLKRQSEDISSEGDERVGAALVEVMLMLISEDYTPLAPSVLEGSYGVTPSLGNGNDVSLMASYDSGYVYPMTSLRDYIRKEAVCVISEKGSDSFDGIKYIEQQTVAENTFTKIPFGGEGQFDLKIKVAGVDDTISETFSTVKNIEADTESSTKELYNWDFSTDQTGAGSNVPVLGGNAIYDANSQSIKLTPTDVAGGNLGITFDKPITAAQGEKITVVSKIAYGNLSGKYMTYELTDSKGNMLIRSNINRYTGKTQSLTIGGVEQLTDGAYPSALQKIDNNATTPAGKFSIYTAVIDPASNEITLKVSNTANSTVNEYHGKLPAGTSYDLNKIYFTTDYATSGRSCYVDDISVTKTKAESYTIEFQPVGADGENITDASVTVTDGITGAVISPESDGTYKLCDGLYNYIVTADGEPVNGTLELSPATESKTVIVPMN